MKTNSVHIQHKKKRLSKISMLRQMFSTPEENQLEKRLRLEEFYITNRTGFIPRMTIREYYNKINKKKYVKQHHKL